MSLCIHHTILPVNFMVIRLVVSYVMLYVFSLITYVKDCARQGEISSYQFLICLTS